MGDEVEIASEERLTKKRKRMRNANATPMEETIQHPRLDIVDESGEKEETTVGMKINDKRTTVHRTAIFSPNITKSAKKSRISMTKDTIAHRQYPNGLDAVLVPLNHLIEERVKQRLSSGNELSRIDFSDSDENEEDSMLVCNGFENMSQSDEHDMDNGDNLERADSADLLVVSKTEQEHASFEASVKKLTKEVAEAKSSLEIIMVELKSMGFGSENSDPQAVLQAVRSAFSSVRNRLRVILPVESSDSVLENVLLNNIVERLISIDRINKGKDRQLQDKALLEKDLMQQINSLVEKLADAEVFKRGMEQSYTKLDSEFTYDQTYIDEMEVRLVEIGREHERVSTMLQAKVDELDDMTHENASLKASLSQLESELVSYKETEREFNSQVEETILNMNAQMESLKTGFEGELADLTQRIENETIERHNAEEKSNQLTVDLRTITKALEDGTVQLEGLQIELDQVKVIRDDVQEQLNTSDTTIREQETIISELQNDLEVAETCIANQEEQLTELKQLRDAEKKQRESAESDLDESRDKIVQMEDKIRKTGIEANELRQKLYEAQLRHEKSIKDMQANMDQKYTQHQKELTDESNARKAAEILAAENEGIIDNLKVSLQNIEMEFKQEIQQRDGTIIAMKTSGDLLESQFHGVNVELERQVEDFNKLVSESEGRISTLKEQVEQLETDLGSKEVSLVRIQDEATKQQKLMTDALHERDATIAVQINEIDGQEKYIDALKHEKQSLESRVESEAEAMLTYQAEKEAEIVDLQATVSLKFAEVQDLSIKATEADKAWNAVKLQHEETISTLQSTAQTYESQLEVQKDHNKEMRDLFAKFAEQAAFTTAQLGAEINRLASTAVGCEESLTQNAATILQRMDVMISESADKPSLVRVESRLSMESRDTIMSTPSLANKLMKRFGRKGKKTRESGHGTVSSDRDEEGSLMAV